jgi:hypothetical protein
MCAHCVPIEDWGREATVPAVGCARRTGEGAYYAPYWDTGGGPPCRAQKAAGSMMG